MESAIAERNERLRDIAVGPVLWFAHFLACYGTVSVWCAKVVGRTGQLGGARLAIAAYTAVALAGIAAAGWRGWKRHRNGPATPPHDDDSPADRHRALGYVTVLLSGLSAVATLYVALAAVFVGSCR